MVKDVKSYIEAKFENKESLSKKGNKF